MKHFLLLLTCFIGSALFSQTLDSSKIIGIHPAVGKSITKDEKVRYHLFPEYKDSLFESAHVLKYNDTTFALVIKPINASEIVRSISTKELDALYYNVEDIEALSKKTEDAYAFSSEEKKEGQKKHHNGYWDDALSEFLWDLFALTFEVLITAAFSN